MYAIETVSLLFAAVMLWLAARAVVRIVRMSAGENRGLMFASSYGVLCDGAGRTGVSAICTSLGSADEVADMLGVEYERYEVVVATDSAAEPDILTELIDRYCLVAVDYPRSDMPPSGAVRRLYRSHCRRFRRLAVVDVASGGRRADIDAAADVAVYNYIMPLCGGRELLPHAVERLVAEICSSEEPPREVCTAVGAPLRLFHRDDVAAGGGFASGRRHFCRRRDRACIYEPLAVWRRPRFRGFAVFAAAVAVTVAAAAMPGREGMPMLSVVIAAWSVVAAAAVAAATFVPARKMNLRAAVAAMENFCEKTLLKISQ